MRSMFVAAFAFFAFAGGGASAQAPDAASFAQAPSLRSVSLSPNGRYLAYIRDVETNDLLVVADLTTNQAQGIQSVSETTGRFTWVRWKSDDRLLFGVRQTTEVASRDRTGSRVNDVGGFDFTRWRVFAINRQGGSVAEMFGQQSNTLSYGLGSTFLVDALPSDPDHVLLTATDNAGVGVWRANVTTGRVERVANGEFETIGYVTDGEGYPVVRTDVLRNGSGYRIMRRAPGERRWTEYREVRGGGTATNSPDFQLVGSGPGAGQVYVLSRQEGQDFLNLYLFDTASGQLSAPLHEGHDADVYYPWIHPGTRDVLARCAYAQRLRCTSPDSNVDRHLRAVEQFVGPDVTVTLVDISDDANIWLLHAEGPQEPGGYYVYDRAAANMRPVAQIYPNAPRNALSPTQVVSYTARDGAQLWAYVTARPGSGPRPMVVMPHGGPESRDHFGYDTLVQFLAAQGYVVVQPNFRGSLGFGRTFADAGRGQWGLRMQDDVTDAVRHMVDSGVADAQRVCIVGISYGGYAALAGVTLTPELYRCAVSIAGVSDLLGALRSERLDTGRASMNYHYWLRSIGDPRANQDALRAASPAQLADRVTAPVLLVHGSGDEIVQYSQSETMQRALQRAGKQSRLVRIADADHPWVDWTEDQQRMLFQETQAFLAAHIGN